MALKNATNSVNHKSSDKVPKKAGRTKQVSKSKRQRDLKKAAGPPVYPDNKVEVDKLSKRKKRAQKRYRKQQLENAKKRGKLRGRRSPSSSSSSSSNTSDRNTSESEDSDLDLTKPCPPIRNLISDKVEMTKQMFHAVGTAQLQALLPNILKDTPIEELKQLCIDQLEIMPKKRIINTLEGKEMSSSSGTDDESSEGDQQLGDARAGSVQVPPHPHAISGLELQPNAVPTSTGRDKKQQAAFATASDKDIISEDKSVVEDTEKVQLPFCQEETFRIKIRRKKAPPQAPVKEKRRIRDWTFTRPVGGGAGAIKLAPPSQSPPRPPPSGWSDEEGGGLGDVKLKTRKSRGQQYRQRNPSKQEKKKKKQKAQRQKQHASRGDGVNPDDIEGIVADILDKQAGEGGDDEYSCSDVDTDGDYDSDAAVIETRRTLRHLIRDVCADLGELNVSDPDISEDGEIQQQTWRNRQQRRRRDKLKHVEVKETDGRGDVEVDQSLADDEDVDAEQCEKTEFELLELEMKARALRALLQDKGGEDLSAALLTHGITDSGGSEDGEAVEEEGYIEGGREEGEELDDASYAEYYGLNQEYFDMAAAEYYSGGDGDGTYTEADGRYYYEGQEYYPYDEQQYAATGTSDGQDQGYYEQGEYDESAYYYYPYGNK